MVLGLSTSFVLLACICSPCRAESECVDDEQHNLSLLQVGLGMTSAKTMDKEGTVPAFCTKFGDHCTRCGSAMNPQVQTDAALISSTSVASSAACTVWCATQEDATCCHYMDYDVAEVAGMPPGMASADPYDVCSEVTYETEDGRSATETRCFCGAYSGSASAISACGTVAQAKYGADCA